MIQISDICLTMNKSDSVSSMKSFSSDQLDQETLADEDFEHEVAPWDVSFNHEGVGTILVAKKGETLPLTTKYKRKDATSTPVKFHVTKMLDVIPIDYEPKAMVVEKVATVSTIPKPNFVNLTVVEEQQDNVPTGDSNINGVDKEAVAEANIQSPTVAEANIQPPTVAEAINQSPTMERSGGPRFTSVTDFVMELERNFENKVITGLEVGLRSAVLVKYRQNLVLLPKENNAIVNSVLQAILDQFGSQERPAKNLCEKLSDLLKVKFPATYRLQAAVQSPLGALAMQKRKGEGGYSGLAKRIGDNFYNRHIRPNLIRPAPAEAGCTVGNKRKKLKGGYCLTGEKWNIDQGASKAEKDEAIDNFVKLGEATTLEEKKALMEKARLYIQNQFRELEPGQAVEDLRHFWEAGPDLLSEWFEWLVGGSKHGKLSLAAAEQLTKVINIVEDFIISKRGEEFAKEMEVVKAESLEENGNIIMYEVFLFRLLSKLFKNKPEKLIYIDGTDDKKNGPEEKDPNIFVTKQQALGIEEYEKKVILSLRIGDKVICHDVSLAEALAGVVQIYFAFNILYPVDVDDTLQFLERIVCNFGSQDGARNKKNVVKKGYRDFEVNSHFFNCCFCFIIIPCLESQKTKIVIFQGFAANLLLASNEGEMMSVFV